MNIYDIKKKIGKIVVVVAVAVLIELLVFDFLVKLQFSFSRIIAVISIYLGVVCLFNLQKSPDYQIVQRNDNSPRRD